MTSEGLAQSGTDGPERPKPWLRNIKLYAQRCLSYFVAKIMKMLSFTIQASRSSAKFVSRYKKFLPILGFGAIVFMTAQVVGFSTRILPLIAEFLALAISIALWFIPRRTFVTLFANTFGWLPVFLGSLTYPFWYIYADNFNGIEAEFFHASADVLPVLLLAAVIDVRRSETLESKGLVLPIIAVFLGEVAALNALAFGYARPEDFAAVASSLVSTTLALVLAVMADLSEPLNGKEEDADSSEGETPRNAMPEQMIAD